MEVTVELAELKAMEILKEEWVVLAAAVVELKSRLTLAVRIIVLQQQNQ
jgi:hypothetical protein